MSAARNRAIVFLSLSLLALGACDRKVDRGDFLPSSPAFQEALRIVIAAASVPADGASTVRIEAQIDPDADADKRNVRFHTSLGGWVVPGSNASGPQVVTPADNAGKAVAFLKSDTTEGVAAITVSVLDSANNVLATVKGEVSFTRVQGALELTVTPESTFADGVSTIVAEARISADSPSTWNQVNFSTDAGLFDNGMKTKMKVQTDAQRIARVQLTSAKVESGTITATIEGFTSSTVRQFIAFDQRNPNTVQIGASASTVPADGATEISVVADIIDGLTMREVTFTTTGGKFVGGTNDGMQIKATPDASNRANVRLTAGETIKEVLLKAQVTLNDKQTVQSSDMLINFIRALPQFIEVSVSGSPPFPAATTSATITAVLTRDIGAVSPNTVVSYSIALPDGTPVTDMEFNTVTRSVKDGDTQKSTAVLDWSSADISADPVVVVKASVGGTSGSISFQITDD